MGDGEQDYISYLLRLWREDNDEPVWRYSLQDPKTGELVGFPSLDALLRFLFGRMYPLRDDTDPKEIGPEAKLLKS